MECVLALAAVKTLLILLIEFPSTQQLSVLTCLSQGVTHPQIKRCTFNGEVTSYQTHVYAYLYRDRINFSFSVCANLIFHITAWYVSRLQ